MPKFIKEIIKPGKYNVPQPDGTFHEVDITPERIKGWVTTFDNMKSLGLRVPAPWRHETKAVPFRQTADNQDVDAYNNAGWWDKLWANDAGELVGEVDVPNDADASKFGTTVKDVSLLAKPSWIDGDKNEFTDALTHIALVTHPVAKSDKNFKPVPTENGVLACSLSMALETLSSTSAITTNAPGNTASTATVRDGIKLLAELTPPVILPEDTTVDNFLERLVIAINAIKAVTAESEAGSESISEPPPGSREKPGPIAMSKETELKLSEEDQATINFATKSVRRTYQTRIEDCVKRGKITPLMAKEQGTPLLESLELAFSADGEPIKGPIDLVIGAWESIPDNSVLTGMSPTTARAHKGSLFGGAEQAFSLTAGLTEPEAPNLDIDPTTELEMSSEETEKFVESQLQTAGLSESQVEGGYSHP